MYRPIPLENQSSARTIGCAKNPCIPIEDKTEIPHDQLEIVRLKASERVQLASTFQIWRGRVNDNQSPAEQESFSEGAKNRLLGQAPYPFGTSLGRSAHLESNSNGVTERACQAWWKRWNQPSWKFVMTTKLTNLPCGTVEVRVCADQICATGWVSSHHLVPPKEAQLRKSINRGNESIAE